MDKILLVGTGAMSIDYAKVLKALKADFVAVGRGEANCKIFEEKTGCVPVSGGVEAYLQHTDETFEYAIVSTEAAQLSNITCLLLERGIKKILTEKPGGLTRMEIQQICDQEERHGARVHIAYNRRLYASVIQAKKMIQEDGGIKSFIFEFTEWPHTIMKSGIPQKTIDSWFLANSSHVVDLAFYLGGMPTDMHSINWGTANWTKEKIGYAGAGSTDRNASFSYSANWNAPGRWSLEFLTNQRRYIFRPVEKLHVQQLKSVKIEPVDIDDEIDIAFKPGLYRETAAFLGQNSKYLEEMKTMRQQLDMMKLYTKISGNSYNA